MKTTEMILTEILDEKATEFQQKADLVPDRYQDATAKAVGIVKARTLVSNPDGTWTVRDTANGSGTAYTVNGHCPCKAALRDKTRTGAAKGICKHRIAVKLARQVNQWFNDHAAQQHDHACLGCQMVYTCWEEPCHETKHLPECEACVTMDGGPEVYTESTLDQQVRTQREEEETMPNVWCSTCQRNVHSLTQVRDAAGTTVAVCHACAEQIAAPQPSALTLTTEELTTLAEPLYEVNPQTLCPTCKIDLTLIDHSSCQAFEASVGQPGLPVVPVVTTLPEAPASLNLKIKRGSIEIMYTMRALTDREILNRLPAALDGLERALGVQFDPPPQGK